jgi:hypothetical protein
VAKNFVPFEVKKNFVAVANNFVSFVVKTYLCNNKQKHVKTNKTNMGF